MTASFETLRHPDPAIDQQFVQLADHVNSHGGTYHRMDFGRGVVISGTYDMSRYLGHYELPATLENHSVLDAGTAAGYFALECARRGARVTAIDTADQPLLGYVLPLINADVQYRKVDIYDLTPEFGQYDVVICGSVLLHLPDPLGALRRLRSVCRKQAIVCTACPDDSETDQRGICEFVGQHAQDGDYWTYWSIGAVALRRMLHAAGFSSVESERHFTVTSEPGQTHFVVRLVVMTANV